jgi:predicted O-methyltransferase YrrM
MDFLDPALEAYCVAHTSRESDLLKDLNRQTHLKVLKPRMLSGHLQGRFLALLSSLQKPQRILEIGTYTGYATLCLGEGLPPNGHLHTIDNNPETQAFAQNYFERAGLVEKVTQHLGAAAVVIPTLNEAWDLVFIDADKPNYALYFDLVIKNMQPGGLIIADNVLWSGKVIEPVKAKDKSTQALLDYNTKINKDPRVENILLPLRDGLMLCRVL